ncbi:response regulator transcription factor [Robinsoniella peoriensis]|uniref:response regulator transcription factor n=1 Tax=Robinsoniella peoriensis TaxID=180332 RepID=UPI0005C7BB27|nr:response regulator [Robinsoniella peoriensis]
MYKVIIADDEPLLRFAVRNLLRWEDYGFVVEGEAGDGLEVLKMVQEINPDLIFTDIRMPNMDGLEMVKLLHEESAASVVILSNYDDFNYAQAALRLGVDDYVLKSALDEEHLERILEKVRRKLEAYQQQNPPQENLERKTNNMTTILKEMIQRKGVTDIIAEAEPQLLSLLNGMYYVIFVTDSEADYLHRIYESAENSPISMFNNFIENIVRDRLHNRGCYFFIKDAGCVVVLSRLDFDELDGKGLLHSITNLLERYTNRIYLAGISRFGQGTEQFYTLYKESVFAADRYFFDQTKRVISYDAVNAPSSDHMRTLLERIFEQAGEMSWVSGIPLTILEMLDELKDTQLLSANCKTILSNVLLLYGMKLTGDHNEFMNLNERFAEKVQYAGTYSVMRQEVESLLDCMGTCVNEMGKYSLPVLQTIQWIKDNYRERITLVLAAEQMAVHPNHLSRIFSQQTGNSFSAYLNDYRMERAKALLLDRALSVQEIGEKVGIPNGKYFGDAFKKWCGMSPREYRQMVLKQK